MSVRKTSSENDFGVSDSWFMGWGLLCVCLATGKGWVCVSVSISGYMCLISLQFS